MKETTGVITNHLSQYLQNMTYIFARVLGLCKFYLKVLHPVFTLLANATRTFASVVKTFLFLLFVADGSKVCFEPSLSNICLLHVVKDKFVAHLPWLGCEFFFFFFLISKKVENSFLGMLIEKVWLSDWVCSWLLVNRDSFSSKNNKAAITC